MNTAIKNCKVHHFADDTNLLHGNGSIEKLIKLADSNWGNLTNQLNANKITESMNKITEYQQDWINTV